MFALSENTTTTFRLSGAKGDHTSVLTSTGLPATSRKTCYLAHKPPDINNRSSTCRFLIAEPDGLLRTALKQEHL